MVRRAKAVGQLAAAQHAQQQRQGEDEAAAALEQLKQEQLCEWQAAAACGWLRTLDVVSHHQRMPQWPQWGTRTQSG
jgi:hypothetical protein